MTAPAILPLKDAQRDNRSLRIQDNGDGTFSFQHLEDPTQRAALVAAITAVRDRLIDAPATAQGQATMAAALATIGAAVAASTPAGENVIGKVGGNAVVASAVLATTVGAYNAGEVIGGLMTFNNMARTPGGTGLIQMGLINCKANITIACDLVLFHTQPTVTTGLVDKAVLGVAPADFDKVLGVIHIADWTSLGAASPSPSTGQATQLAMAYKAPSEQTTLYGVLVTRSGFNMITTSDFKVVVKALLD